VSVAGSVRHGGAGFEGSSMTTLFNHTIVAAGDKYQSASAALRVSRDRDDFDGIYARIQATGIEYWADP
jgi:hypothetical protein